MGDKIDQIKKNMRLGKNDLFVTPGIKSKKFIIGIWSKQSQLSIISKHKTLMLVVAKGNLKSTFLSAVLGSS